MQSGLYSPQSQQLSLHGWTIQSIHVNSTAEVSVVEILIIIYQHAGNSWSLLIAQKEDMITRYAACHSKVYITRQYKMFKMSKEVLFDML